MEMSKSSPQEEPASQEHTLVEVINEVNSAPIIRQRLIKELYKLTGRHTLNYVSSFAPHPAAFINDWDAEIIENILKSLWVWKSTFSGLVFSCRR